MSNTFLISDTHYGHNAACTLFKLADGVTPLRPFANAAEADEAMIERWNSVVKPNDKVYHLGDVVMPKHHRVLDEILPKLNGTKVLIKGNHDELEPARYLTYFKDIRAIHLLDNIALTHVPLHTASLVRWRANIHGHLHANNVVKDNGLIDPKYFCVCVEQINYTPIPFELINNHFKSLGI